MPLTVYGVKLPDHQRADAYALHGSRGLKSFRLIHKSGREAVSTSQHDLKDLGLQVRLPSERLIGEMESADRSIVGDADGNVWLSETILGAQVTGLSESKDFRWERIRHKWPWLS